jgi:hypothetical protein
MDFSYKSHISNLLKELNIETVIDVNKRTLIILLQEDCQNRF